MTLHETIKNQIKEALRAKDTIRLDTLRGLNALALNELLATKVETKAVGNSANKNAPEFLADEKMLILVKRSVKQRKDSIDQFTKGGRKDLASKEQAELTILESFMPSMMTREQIKIIAHQRIDALKSAGNYDPKAGGKITGMIMKELAGKADGTDVKAVVEELMKE
jgi:uncharacterized protein YqeY